jgi:hypothetical protein
VSRPRLIAFTRLETGESSDGAKVDPIPFAKVAERAGRFTDSIGGVGSGRAPTGTPGRLGALPTWPPRPAGAPAASGGSSAPCEHRPDSTQAGAQARHPEPATRGPEPALITVVVAAVGIVALVLLLVLLWGMNDQ